MQRSKAVSPPPGNPNSFRKMVSQLNWFSSSWQAEIIGQQNLSTSRAILLVRRSQLRLMESLADRIFPLSSETNRVLIVGVTGNQAQLTESLLEVLELARREHRVIIPAAASASPAIRLPLIDEKLLPLPNARVILCIEAPFQIPDHPLDIPPTWLSAIEHLLDSAGTCARDMLLAQH
jgi:hypothetical protein